VLLSRFAMLATGRNRPPFLDVDLRLVIVLS
jgi:hypothetical protein